MKRICNKNTVFAFVLSPDDFRPGANFISEPDWPLQVGLMKHPSGHSIAPHSHLVQNSPRVQPTQEFLLVICGKLEVDFFDESGRHIQTETLTQGDALFHIRGGHGFRFHESTQLIEVKSGPYLGRDKDKVPLQTGHLASFVLSGAVDK